MNKILNIKINILLLLFLVLSCKIPLGPKSPEKNYDTPKAYIKGVILKDGDTLNNISVAVLPFEDNNFSRFVIGSDEFSHIAEGLTFTQNNFFNIAFTLPEIQTHYILLTGLGMHDDDANYVQELSIDITGQSLGIGSPFDFFLDPILNENDTLRFTLNLVHKVQLYRPDSYGLWASGEKLSLHPTYNNSVTIRWTYSQMQTIPPNHTRFIFILWSLKDGLIYYTPSSTDSIQSQQSVFTELEFPPSLEVANMLQENESYRITICAIQNIEDYSQMYASTTELLFDGEFIYR